MSSANALWIEPSRTMRKKKRNRFIRLTQSRLTALKALITGNSSAAEEVLSDEHDAKMGDSIFRSIQSIYSDIRKLFELELGKN